MVFCILLVYILSEILLRICSLNRNVIPLSIHELRQEDELEQSISGDIIKWTLC